MSDVQSYLLKVDEDKEGAQQIVDQTAHGKMPYRLSTAWTYGLICRQVLPRKRNL